MSGRTFRLVNATAVGAAVALIAGLAGVEGWLSIVLIGAGIGIWWWVSTDMALDLEANVGEPIPWEDVKDELRGLGIERDEIYEVTYDEALESEEPTTEEATLIHEVETADLMTEILPVRQLERKSDNSDLALRADRAYTIDQMLRGMGYRPDPKNDLDFWTDSYQRHSRGETQTLATRHELGQSTLWKDREEGVGVLSIKDPIDENVLESDLREFLA